MPSSSGSSGSTVTLGRIRSSHFGNHQFDLPRRIITHGTTAMRMSTASTRMPPARPQSELLDDPHAAQDEGPEHQDKAVGGGHCGHGIVKDLVPVGKDQVGGDNNELPFVALGKKVKKDFASSVDCWV